MAEKQSICDKQPVAVLSGGGTAGHINPALALAERLEHDGWKVYFAGTPEGIESRLVPQAGIEFKAFRASGFDRAKPYTLIKGVSQILTSSHAAKTWFKEIKPDVVVGFGGYVSMPVVTAAEQMGIPVVVHEQNSVMGMANKYAARKANAICLTYPIDDLSAPPGVKVVVTGNPVRASITEVTRQEGRRAFEIPEDALVLLVFGGSLGARHINEAICRVAPELMNRKSLYVIHVTGPKELESVKAELNLNDADASRWLLYGYLDNMPYAMAAANVVVSRAGATSLAEIAARCMPALLVPYPYATADHQTANARANVEAGAAFCVADDDLDKEIFKDELLKLIDDECVRQSMMEAARSLEANEATDKLAGIVESVIQK